MKTFFLRSPEWVLLSRQERPKLEILERCVFEYPNAGVELVADAYKGSTIEQAILAFLDAASGAKRETVSLHYASKKLIFSAEGAASLVAYVGHDGLMDFQLPRSFRKQNEIHHDVMILACVSRQYFAER